MFLEHKLNYILWPKCGVFSLPHPFLPFQSCLPFQSDFVPCTRYCWRKWEGLEWRQQSKLWLFMLSKKSTQCSFKFFRFLPSFCLSSSWVTSSPFICFVLWFSLFWICSLSFSPTFPIFLWNSCCLLSRPQPSIFSCHLHCIQQKWANKLCSCLDEKQPSSLHHCLSILRPYLILTLQWETSQDKKNQKPLKSCKRVNVFLTILKECYSTFYFLKMPPLEIYLHVLFHL